MTREAGKPDRSHQAARVGGEHLEQTPVDPFPGRSPPVPHPGVLHTRGRPHRSAAHHHGAHATARPPSTPEGTDLLTTLRAAPDRRFHNAGTPLHTPGSAHGDRRAPHTRPHTRHRPEHRLPPGNATTPSAPGDHGTAPDRSPRTGPRSPGSTAHIRQAASRPPPPNRRPHTRCRPGRTRYTHRYRRRSCPEGPHRGPPGVFPASFRRCP